MSFGIFHSLGWSTHWVFSSRSGTKGDPGFCHSSLSSVEHHNSGSLAVFGGIIFPLNWRVIISSSSISSTLFGLSIDCFLAYPCLSSQPLSSFLPSHMLFTYFCFLFLCHYMFGNVAPCKPSSLYSFCKHAIQGFHVPAYLSASLILQSRMEKRNTLTLTIARVASKLGRSAKERQASRSTPCQILHTTQRKRSDPATRKDDLLYPRMDATLAKG